MASSTFKTSSFKYFLASTKISPLFKAKIHLAKGSNPFALAAVAFVFLFLYKDDKDLQLRLIV